ncbi:MAG: capsule assembly Wzi family protein [Longimicrobiales bacterium]|nr:capsule assembly Wzi family protein [Longimicrobiales bacterium]
MRTLLVILPGLLALTAAPAQAQLWPDAADAALRRDVELLAAYGRISGPVTTWPLAWAQLTQLLDAPARARASAAGGAPGDGDPRAVAAPLPPHVRRAEARVRAAAGARARPGETHLLIAGGAGRRDPLMGSADGGLRQDAELQAALHHAAGGRVHLRLAGTWREDQRGRDVTLDGTHAAVRLGNWAAWAGSAEEWWGGGWDGALVLSTNARPLPRVGVRRLVPAPLDLPVLRWLGPWSLSASLGRQEEDREVSHPVVLLTRLAIRPVRWLDLGFSRGIQICGEGRACGLDRWVKALVGVGDLDNTGDSAEDPSNQLAAVDARVAGRVGPWAWAAYGELMGEDQGAFLLKAVSALGGVVLEGYAPALDAGWRLRLEAADTRAGSVFGLSDPQLRTTYNHFIYRDGWSYQGRTLGHSLDTDSRLLTAEALVTDAAGRAYRVGFRHVLLNTSASARHKLSDSPETVRVLEAGVEIPLAWGTARGDLAFQDDQPDTPGVRDTTVRAEVGWRLRF